MQADLRFRAMGSDVHIVVHGPVELAEVGRDLIEELEARWSRFRDDSEVTRLNAAAGTWFPVSAETLLLVDRALRGWQVTSGRFDPTVLGDLERAGYDRSLISVRSPLISVRSSTPGGRGLPPEQIPGKPTRAVDSGSDGRASTRVRGAEGIAIDHQTPAVHLPSGVGFDPGGLGKGLAADLVAQRIIDEGAAGVLVNVGGDLRARGCAVGGEDWVVDLDPAVSGHPVATVVLEQGAVATSTTLRRAWEHDGRRFHHIIDPTTGEPADRGVVAASVLAAEGWQAEVLAKGALLAGVHDGLDLLAATGTDGILVDHLGGLHPTPGFRRFGRVAVSPPGRAAVDPFPVRTA